MLFLEYTGIFNFISYLIFTLCINSWHFNIKNIFTFKIQGMWLQSLNNFTIFTELSIYNKFLITNWFNSRLTLGSSFLFYKFYLKVSFFIYALNLMLLNYSHKSIIIQWKFQFKIQFLCQILDLLIHPHRCFTVDINTLITLTNIY